MNRSGRPSWDSQPTATEGPAGGQMYYANQAATGAPNAGSQQTATAAPAQQTYSVAAPPAPINTNVPASAFPAVTNQICTCMAVSESTAADMLEQAQQKPTPAQQPASAQQTYSSSQPASAQTGSYSAPSQSTTDGDRATARPTYATPVNAAGY